MMLSRMQREVRPFCEGAALWFALPQHEPAGAGAPPPGNSNEAESSTNRHLSAAL
jgi:hypothetical protein